MHGFGSSEGLSRASDGYAHARSWSFNKLAGSSVWGASSADGRLFEVYCPTIHRLRLGPRTWNRSNKEVREVKHQFGTWRVAARVLVLAMAVTAIPLPSLADEMGRPVATPLKASITKAAAANRMAVEQAKPADAKPVPDKTDLGSGSFFKKPAGAVVLAVLGVGIGFMAYSMSHDRIHSVVRQNQ